ncbi:MAG: S8 family serine peptidase [Pseudomonadota bacterium]
MPVLPSLIVRSPLSKSIALSAVLLCTSAAPLLSLASTSLASTEDPRPQITRESDIPRSTYRLTALPSELILEQPEALIALRDELELDVSQILDQYDIQDKSSKQSLLRALLRVSFAKADWSGVLSTIEQMRDLEDTEADRAAVSFVYSAFATAALELGHHDLGSAEFRDAYRSALTDQIAAMDLAVSESALRSTKNTAEIISLELVRGGLEGALDPNVEAQNFEVNRGTVSALLANHQSLQFMQLGDITATVIGDRLAAEPSVTDDLWSQRLVDLQQRDDLTPVTVSIWDTGTDVSQFVGRVWENPAERMNGLDDDGNGFIDDVNGIAFAPDWARSTGVLRPVTEEDANDIDRLLKLVKGSRDMSMGLDTEDASTFRKTMAGLQADEVMPFQLQLGRMGLYLHGTATADVAQRGNPAIRLLPVRFDQTISPVPVPFDEDYAERFARYVDDSVNYMDAAGARVVNMSWRFTTPMIERSLASVEPDADRRRARAIEIFDTMNAALISAFESKPHMLFVAGAGNEDEDVEFVRSLPAGINRPNLITVGAVNQALQETNFTSYGESIDIYANGQEVPSRVPGGMTISLSGTSIAAPQVANLAAMIWAIEPELSVSQVRQKIIDNATAEGEKLLPVISPVATLAQLDQ